MATVLVEPDGPLVTYATAGHLPILVRRASTWTVEILSAASGPAFCAIKDVAYTQSQTDFGIGASCSYIPTGWSRGAARTSVRH